MTRLFVWYRTSGGLNAILQSQSGDLGDLMHILDEMEESTSFSTDSGSMRAIDNWRPFGTPTENYGTISVAGSPLPIIKVDN